MQPPETPPTVVAYAFLDFSDGGAQRLTLASWRHLDPGRFVPVLVCVRGAGRLVAAARRQGVAVHILGRLERPFDLAAAWHLVGLFRRIRAGIVHVPLYSRASPYVRLAARLAPVPLVVAHDYCRPQPPRLPRRLADRLLRHRTRFVATSARQASELELQGVPAAAIEVVHSGIEVADYPPADRHAARRRLDLPADRPIVLTPARLHPMKGHLDLLAALPLLRRKVPEVLVLCAGDGPLAGDLERRTREAGLAPAVRFLGHRDDVPELLAACDVVALPSRVEGIPSAMLEAFAARRAVVATDVGGVGEALSGGIDGWLVEPRAPRAMARALTEALTDHERRAEVEARARRTVRERFEARRTTRRLESVYDRWLSEAARP